MSNSNQVKEPLINNQNVLSVNDIDDQKTKYSTNDTPDQRSESDQEPLIQNYKQIPSVKWTFIVCACCIWLGAFYTNSFHSYLKVALLVDLDIDEADFQLFSILGNLPPIFFCFFGGVILDFIGVRRAIIIYSLVVAIGAVITVIATLSNSFAIMLLGRTINNVGSEITAGAVNALLAGWFSGGELTKVSSINIFVGRLGGAAAGWIYYPLYDKTQSLELPLLIGTIICLISVGFACGAATLDYRADQQKLSLGKGKEKQKPKMISFKDIQKFPPMYWFILILLGLNYGIYFPFVGNLQTVFKTKFNINPGQASSIMTIPMIIGLCSPLLGILVDKFGRQMYYLVSAGIFGVIGISVMYFVPTCTEDCMAIVVFPMICLGFLLMFTSVIVWPSVAMVAPVEVLGSAFGIGYAFKAIVGVLVPLAVGPLLKSGIPSFMFFFWILQMVALIWTIFVYAYDFKKGGAIKKKQLTKQQIKTLRRTTTYGAEFE